MMGRIWEKGVPPEEFKPAVRREVPRVALHSAKAIGRAYWQVARLLADSPSEEHDLTWMNLPRGHRKLSDDRKAFDVVLRYFHEGVAEVELDVILVDPSDVLGERNRFPSPNRPDATESVSLGGLKVEEARGVYADGRLFLPKGECGATLQCVVPKRKP